MVGSGEYLPVMDDVDRHLLALVNANGRAPRVVLCQPPQVKTNHEIILTISLGVSCWDSKEELSFDSLLYRADQALYRSKNEARNRVTIW